MAKLEWDKIEERLYEAGIDHGVLYIPSAPGVYDNGVVWNGLTSIEEDFSHDSTNQHYFDGVKYLDSYNTGDFSATLSAFTYPDEFLYFEGLGSLGNGAFVDNQAAKPFGLSYRTLAGSYSEGLTAGYKIHLLYNLMVRPDSVTYENAESPEPINFSWTVTSIPEVLSEYRPTAHVILDSRFLDSEILSTIESILYGSSFDQTVIDGLTPSTMDGKVLDGGTAVSSGPPIIDGNPSLVLANPTLPPISTLIELVLGWSPRIIIPQLVTGLSQLVPGYGDLTQTKLPGIYYTLPETNLVETQTDGIYRLGSP